MNACANLAIIAESSKAAARGGGAEEFPCEEPGAEPVAGGGSAEVFLPEEPGSSLRAFLFDALVFAVFEADGGAGSSGDWTADILPFLFFEAERGIGSAGEFTGSWRWGRGAGDVCFRRAGGAEDGAVGVKSFPDLVSLGRSVPLAVAGVLAEATGAAVGGLAARWSRCSVSHEDLAWKAASPKMSSAWLQ